MKSSLILLLVLLSQTTTMFAATEPSDADVNTAYRAYRAEICTAAGMVDGNHVPVPSCVNGGVADAGVQRIVLEEYCANHNTGACSTVSSWEKTLRLAYDHTAANWIVPAGTLAKRTKLDINRVPTVSLARSEELYAIIANSNPLLYGVTAAEIKEEAIPQLADLQKLAGLLGGNIAAVISARATSVGATLLDDDVTALQKVADHVKQAQCITTATTHYSFSAVSFIQAVENGDTAMYDLSDESCNNSPANMMAFDQAWQNLLADQAVVGQQCSEVFDALAALEAANPSKFDDIQQALTTYNLALQNPKCSFFNANRATDVQAQFLDDIESALATKDAAVLSDKLQILRSQLGKPIGTLQILIKNGGEALNTLVSSAGTVRKALASRTLFRNRVLQSLVKAPAPCANASTDACTAADDVTRLIVVSGGPTKVAWDKVQSHPIHIAADSPFAADVTAARPAPLDTSYKATSTASAAYDVGVAVTKTRLASPTFGVEKNDAGATVIAVSDESTRSGKLALMFNYLPLRQTFADKPGWLTSLGIQIGSSLSTDNPGYFYGLSYGLGKYVRLGWGETRQRVNALRGQAVGNPVPDKDSIHTRQAFRGAKYFSLTISIGSLKFFNAS